jgi:sugar/nucleoside kinase (ribokinase family)
MSKHIVSLGDLVIDLITPVTLPIYPFQHQETRGAYLEAGGSGNFLIAGARLGLRMSAVGAIGDDVFGRFLLDVLQTEGIDTRGVAVQVNTSSVLVLDLIDQAKHEHVFVGSHGNGEAATYTEVMQTIVASADAVFVQGFTLHERPTSILLHDVLAHVRNLSIPIYFDVGPTVRHLPYKQVRAILREATVLMLTEDELPLATNGLTGEAAYQNLLSTGAHTLVIKQGAQGCTIIRHGQVEHVLGFAVTVADTVGAGDCFDAAFIYGQMYGFDDIRAGQLANAVGAASVQKVGAGRNVPTCAEVNAILKQFAVPIELPC